MRKYAQRLYSATHNDDCGNHAVIICGGSKLFFYHGSKIFELHADTKTAVCDTCGYGTKSTKAAINQYAQLAAADGYAVTWRSGTRWNA